MGLPHVLVRFYTNPDGRAARRTTAVVIGLLGVFYLFPPIYGALGRIYAPDLLLTGRTDTVVLALPSRLLPGLGRPAVVAARRRRLRGVLVHRLRPGRLGGRRAEPGPHAPALARPPPARRDQGRSVHTFRVATVVAVIVPLLLSLLTTKVGLADTVGLAFALAASTFCPLLVLGIWWRGLTAFGAIAGLLAGGGWAERRGRRRPCWRARSTAGPGRCSPSPRHGPCPWRCSTMVCGLAAHPSARAGTDRPADDQAAHPRGRRGGPRPVVTARRLVADRSAQRGAPHTDARGPSAAGRGRKGGGGL